MFGKTKAPMIAGATAISLAIIKLIVGILSGSMSVLSSAIDSMLDFVVSELNYFALKKSEKNPNETFNYGYGKIEPLMALFEGVFIVLTGCFIFYTSAQKIFSSEHSIDTNASLYVMLFSLVATSLLIYYLSIVSKKTNSIVIKADSLHYKVDFFTNVGIIVALILIKITNLMIIDAIIGVVVSIYIVLSAIKLIKEGIYILLDGSLEPEIVDDITKFIKNRKEITSFHYLRTRKSAETCFLSAHLVFNDKITLINAHDIGDEIERYIAQKYSKYKWVIDLHFDPKDDSITT